MTAGDLSIPYREDQGGGAAHGVSLESMRVAAEVVQEFAAPLIVMGVIVGLVALVVLGRQQPDPEDDGSQLPRPAESVAPDLRSRDLSDGIRHLHRTESVTGRAEKRPTKTGITR